MRLIAITGSIGMGKSTVAKMFGEAGLPLFDADAEVRAMQGPGGSLVAAISEAFPEAIAGGQLDRELLANIVLEQPSRLKRLEAIVHPAVQEARRKFVSANSAAPALVFEIPLLFETKGDTQFDTVIVVSAPAEIQRERVLARAGMTASRLNSILARQMRDSDKRERADFVIETSGGIDDTRLQVHKILACLDLPMRG